MKPTKAIILAAGRGSRLGHLTKEVPKCLVKLKKKPLISYQIKSLQKAGIKNIALVVGYKSNKLKNYSDKIFKNNFWNKNQHGLFVIMCKTMDRSTGYC